MGSSYYYVPPVYWFVSFACECRTLRSFKGLACECRVFFYVLPEAEKLNDLNDQ